MLARIRKSVEEKDSGFTLVELLVVMIIIGILAAIAIPVFANQRKKAVDASIKSDLRVVAQEAETAFVDSQAYPTTASSAWVTAGTAGATAGTVLTGAKTTTGNTIEYKPVSGGFCLRGSSTNGTANGTTTGSKYFIYDSTLGGLQTAKADTTTLCTA